MDATTPALERQPAGSLPDYDGRFAGFGGLVLRTTLLTILTLGIYRFWAKTRIRRYIWSHVSILGERFEYTGLGRELFFGFLIVLAIFAALTLVSNLLQIALAGFSVWGEFGIKLAYFGLILYLLPVATYRARRYQLSRTLWRGVRGSQTGSSFAYGAWAFFLQLLSYLTLGLIAPFMRTMLYRRRITNTWLGDRQFSFEGGAARLYAPWMLVFLPGAMAVAIIGYAVYLSAGDIGQLYDRLQQSGDGVQAPFSPDLPPWIFVALPVLVTARYIAYLWYRVKEYRYFAGQTALGDLRFQASLGVWNVVWIYLLYWFALVVGMLVFFLAVGAIFGGIGLDLMATEPGFTTTALPVVTLLFLVMFGAVLRYLLVVHRMARLLCRKLTMTGTEGLDTIAQGTQPVPRRGEGLADMLDAGGI